MDDSRLDYLSGLFVQHDVRHKYGWTFEQFITAYESGHYDRVRLYENVKGRNQE